MIFEVIGHLALVPTRSLDYSKQQDNYGSNNMTRTRQILWPVGAFLAGTGLLSLIYFGIVSWAESPAHALDLFWQDRWLVLPIIIGFGIQSALYIVLRKRLFLPIHHTGPSGALTGASGGVSSAAMVACCAHHVSDVLPILGLTAAAVFLAEYRLAFMWLGLGTTLLGILVMMLILRRERQRALHSFTAVTETT